MSDTHSQPEKQLKHSQTTETKLVSEARIFNPIFTQTLDKRYEQIQERSRLEAIAKADPKLLARNDAIARNYLAESVVAANEESADFSFDKY